MEFFRFSHCVFITQVHLRTRTRSQFVRRIEFTELGAGSIDTENINLKPRAFTAVIRQDGPWWIGWIEEVPGVNSQGETREELISNLREALGEAIEMNREDARRAAGESFEEVAIQP